MRIIPIHFLLLILMQTVAGQTINNNPPVKHFKRINFEPAVFYREYYSGTTAVLTIQPGDTISRESIDAGGFDKKGLKIAATKVEMVAMISKKILEGLKKYN